MLCVFECEVFVSLITYAYFSFIQITLQHIGLHLVLRLSRAHQLAFSFPTSFFFINASCSCRHARRGIEMIQHEYAIFQALYILSRFDSLIKSDFSRLETIFWGFFLEFIRFLYKLVC